MITQRDLEVALPGLDLPAGVTPKEVLRRANELLTELGAPATPSLVRQLIRRAMREAVHDAYQALYATRDPAEAEGTDVAEALADVVMAEIRQRGLLPRAERDAFIAEWQRRAKLLREAEVPVAALASVSSDYVDPLSNKIDDPTEWQLRRGRDNAVGAQAERNLRDRQGDFTAKDYLTELERLQRQVGTEYRDDQAGGSR
jgi:hypothetical protein